MALSIPTPEIKEYIDLASLGPPTHYKTRWQTWKVFGRFTGKLGKPERNPCPETLNAVKTVAVNGTKRAKVLITNASNLLTADLVKQLNELLKELGPVITACSQGDFYATPATTRVK
ncbi:hypothetical protein RJZ56_002675 [Blastomyces dermatitidis]